MSYSLIKVSMKVKRPTFRWMAIQPQPPLLPVSLQSWSCGWWLRSSSCTRGWYTESWHGWAEWFNMRRRVRLVPSLCGRTWSQIGPSSPCSRNRVQVVVRMISSHLSVSVAFATLPRRLSCARSHSKHTKMWSWERRGMRQFISPVH